MNYLKLALAGVVIFVLGSGLGYYMAPDKVREVEKIVEKEKVVKEKEKEVVEKFDPNTGKLTERITRDKEKDSKTNEQKNEKELEKIRDKKHYAVKGGVAVAVKDPSKLVPRIGGEFRLPFFNSWVGAEVDAELANPKVGTYLRMEF